MKKIALISLGCVKNTVDSEAILALFKKPSFEIVTNLNDADVIIINTCGFILSAKIEGINTILDTLQYGKKVVVVGCLVQRYFDELKNSIPEVTMWIPFKDEYTKLPSMIQSLFEDEKVKEEFDIFDRVDDSTYSTYIKISEGCDNFCAFCAIPSIRGRFVSYSIEKIVDYAKKAAKKGSKELVLIGQDPTSYGKDFKGKNINLVTLLRELVKIPDVFKIRLLYLYPDGITDELLEFIKANNKISHYFDIPIQHCSSRILRLMNRRDNKKTTEEIFEKIKREIPDAILRTTLIVGFPGETSKEFNELLDFIHKYKFNHLGCFTYSKEENTRAFYLPHQVRENTKIRRKEIIMRAQAKISYELNKELIGHKFIGIISRKNENDYYVRCDYNAPDDIDGNVILKTEIKHEVGDIVNIEVTHAFVYDLLAKEI